MVVRFKKCVLKIDEIRKEEISLENFLDHEREVVRLIQWWKSNEGTLQFKTSGSTGQPKKIAIRREKIEYSVRATMDKLDPDSNFRSSLLCINPSMIGGAMVIFRSLLRNLDLTVVAPSSNPGVGLGQNETFDLVSMVPMQMLGTDLSFLNRFNTILIGGADYQASDLNTTAKVFQTFGMTETVSHFALKELGKDLYQCIGDTEVAQSREQRLKLKGTLTDHLWLQTNDIVDLISSKQFRWKGRGDFVINSGGIKISPEGVEEKLKAQVSKNFIISSLPDDRLGSKLILIIEGDATEMNLNYSSLLPYEKPRGVYFLHELKRTASSKIDRLGTQESLLTQLSLSKS